MSSYNKNRLLKKGGYVADYAKVSTPSDYTLYVPPPSGSSSSEGAVLVSNQTTATPGMTNGGSKCSGGNVDLPNNFFCSFRLSKNFPFPFQEFHFFIQFVKSFPPYFIFSGKLNFFSFFF